MNVKMVSLFAGILFCASLTGCSASSATDSADEAGQSEDEINQQPERKLQLDALRTRVNTDFAGVESLRGHKLVFVVKKLHSDGERAMIFARIMKRDAAGRTTELSDADLRDSVYKDEIADGVFDGPEVVAALDKTSGAWSVMKEASGNELEAYVVGPTDVAWTDWDTTFGLPRSWLGFGEEQ